MELDNGITYIGVTNYRNTGTRFGIKDKDRLQHIYAIGKSGTGKSTLLSNMAKSDISRGKGLCVIDPHGDLAFEIIRHVPDKRRKDLIYFDATALDSPIAFNPLKGVNPKYHDLVASGLISTFKKIWSENWGPRLEHILRFSLLTLLQVPNTTLLDVQKILTNTEYRTWALNYVTDDNIRSFWFNEFNAYAPRLRSEAIAPILNKMSLFATSNALKKIVGQNMNSFRLQHVLDRSKILIVNLSKGQIGEDASSLLGAMLINAIQLAALHRSQMPEYDRKPFYLYIDECQSFVTLSFLTIVSEARKFGLSLFLTHQYLDQLDERVRISIIGNIGTMICFRIGSKDAEVMAKEFYPIFSTDDFIHLPRYHMYMKLLIDGTASQPFSAKSLPIF